MAASFVGVNQYDQGTPRGRFICLCELHHCSHCGLTTDYEVNVGERDVQPHGITIRNQL